MPEPRGSANLGVRMFLYLVVSAPLFVLALCLFYRVTQLRFSSLVFIRGMVVTLPLLLLWWFLSWFFDLSYTTGALYQHHLFTEFFYPLLPGIVLFYLVERAVLRERGHVSVVSLGVFLGGIYFVHSIADVLRIAHYYGPYIGFMLPTLRLALIAVIPPLLGAASREARPLRFAWAALVLVIPAVFAWPAVLFQLNFFWAGYLLTGAALVLSVALHRVLLDMYYPRRPRAFSASPSDRAVDKTEVGSTEGGAEEEQNAEGPSSGPGTRLFPNSVNDE